MGSKMETNRKVLIRYCLVGAILGYAIFHPLIMLLSNMMATTDTVSNMTDSFDFLDVVMQSFSIAMLPWSLSFALFNGVIGLYYGTIKVEKKKP
jgi:ABC-type antimicrobial peptide transport system permease subunit